MKGANGFLAGVLLLFAFVVVIFCLCGDDAGAATTYIDGDWDINSSTTLSDGTWVVNGTVYVHDGTLRLDDAELVINGSDYYDNRVQVNRSARLEAYGSVIRGAFMTGMVIDLYGDCVLDNTTLSNMDRAYYRAGIYQREGNVLVDHCVFETGQYAIDSVANVTARHCSFYNVSMGVYWHMSSAWDSTLWVEECTFRNVVTISGTGVGAYGPGNQDIDQRGTIKGCTFERFQYAVYVSSFTNRGSMTVEDNRAMECRYGCMMDSVGDAVTVRRNRWEPSSNGYGDYVSTISGGMPSIHNETVVGGSFGLAFYGYYNNLVIRDMHLTGAVREVYVSNSMLDIHASYIRGTTYDFYMSGSGNINLYGCDHTYSGYVSSSNGRISEPSVINFTSVTWQDGTPIEEDRVEFENETGYYLAQRDNEDPMPVSVPTWLKTRYVNITVDMVVGAFEKDDFVFRSTPFSIRDVERMDLVIIDNSTPEVTIKSPGDGEMFPTKNVLVRGTLVERGSGLDKVRVTYNATEWLTAETFPDSTWQVRFEHLPDGLLTFTVNITDRVGNAAELAVANITIDTVAPKIIVVAPKKHVGTTPMRMLVETEPGSRVWVDYMEVEVTPSGMCSALLTFATQENDVHIRVIDAVGHENQTIVKFIYDTTAPALLVDTPKDGEWTSSETVMVTGSTEAEASVTVNGFTGEVDEGRFAIEVPLQGEVTVLTIRAVDMAGNAATMVRTVNKDRGMPDLEVLSPEDGLATTSDRVLVTGQVSDDSHVTVLVGGRPVVLVGPNWSIEVVLEEGVNEIRVTATDVVGNTVEVVLTVTADTIAPEYTAKAVVNGVDHPPGPAPMMTMSSNAEIVVETSERVTLRISALDAVLAGPGIYRQNLLLVPGTNVFTVHVEDGMGNQAEDVTIILVHDDIPPTLTIAGADQVRYVGEGQYLVRGTSEPGCILTISGLPTTVLTNGSFAVLVPLEVGPNSLKVVVRDEAGNEVSETIQVVREEPEEGGVTATGAAVTGAVAGLVGGLLVALAVVAIMARRGRRGPAQEAEPSPPEEKPPEGSGAPPAEPPADPATSEVGDWEMM